MRAGNNGISADTVKNIAFGAGTIHKGLKYTPGQSDTAGTWNFEESCVGATKGGSSVKITPTFYSVQPDGSTVAVKNFKRKTGETATMEVNLLELKEEIIKASVVGKNGASEASDYSLIQSKDAIEEGDYWENIAFVGETLEGKKYICFCTNISQAEVLGGANAIHSEKKSSNQAIIDSFNEGSINSLFAVGMLQEGQNLNGIQAGVIVQLDGKERAFIQKFGRSMRAEDPIQYIFYYRYTQDEKWMKNVLEGIDQNFIKEYEIHN